jgi:hypothetical protein
VQPDLLDAGQTSLFWLDEALHGAKPSRTRSGRTIPP